MGGGKKRVAPWLLIARGIAQGVKKALRKWQFRQRARGLHSQLAGEVSHSKPSTVSSLPQPG